MRHSLTIGIHDIDIARWLFDASKAQNLENPKKQVNRVFAIGQNVRHPELVKDQDADNALAIVEFASGKVLHFHCSRTTMHGHDCVAEVFGTEGRAVVNAVSEALSSIDALSEDWRSRSTGADSRTRF
jgi:myo-inositol 2-dehydrogenase/D-chiro-inositol 1-dehydrogenase